MEIHSRYTTAKAVPSPSPVKRFPASFPLQELLYPPLKELSGKYPDWLADRRSTLKESDFDNYNKQFEVTKQICHVFESATLNAEGKMTKQDFDRVFQLMQKMQSHGHPPKELVGEMPSSPFSGDLAKEQCSIS